MRRKWVIGNWKMHGSRDSIAALLAGYDFSGVDADVAIAICPTSLHIPYVAELMAADETLAQRITLGAQNASEAEAGAFTGEVAAAMLAEAGVAAVLLGHSERRMLFGESDEQVAAKVAAALTAGLQPVVCVGETLEQRQAGETQAVVLRQLNAVAAAVGAEGLARSIVAYEPVWAIGTGETATPEQAQAVHAGLRQRLREIGGDGEGLAAQTAILYGGSVSAGNAAELFAQPDIDGGLVGGASMKAAEFSTICSSF